MKGDLLADIIARKWSILLFAVAAGLLALAVSLLMPKEYLAEASLVPANSRMMDNQRMFGENIQELYSAFGGSDDLDRMFATMRSASVLRYVADSLDLVAHYQIKGEKYPKEVATKKVEKNSKLIRSEYGQLQLKVWDKDTLMARRIAGLMIARTQFVFDALFRQNYDRSIQQLEQEMQKQQQEGSPTVAALTARLQEYKVTRLNPPAAFFVIESPYVSPEPDRPRMLINVVVAVLAALFTALIWIILRAYLRA